MHDHSGDSSCAAQSSVPTDVGDAVGLPLRATPLPAQPTGQVEAKPATGTDLRRRKVREFCDLVVQRAVWLPPSDRVLVEAVYRDNHEVAELARLLNVDARQLRRRVRRLVHRLLSPQFMRVVAELTRPSLPRAAPVQSVESPARAPRGSPWTDHRRRVAEECILNGRSIRDASRALHLSVHCVRRHREAIHSVLTADPVGRRP